MYTLSVPASTRMSSPSRGTWIEIFSLSSWMSYSQVVPLAGDVDRNYICGACLTAGARSSPSRGTWIEIQCLRSRFMKSTMSSPSRGTWIEISDPR